MDEKVVKNRRRSKWKEKERLEMYVSLLEICGRWLIKKKGEG
jgi:hypothetical protein